MKDSSIKFKIDLKYIFVFGIAVFLSWTMHELAHWSAGMYLGYNMGMSLNKTFSLGNQLSTVWANNIIVAAGPIFTLLEAVSIFIIMRRKKRDFLYPFLFTCFYMRLFATIISFRNSNDEAKISNALGIGKFTLPLIITGVLFALIFKVSKDYNYNIKFNFLNLGLAILFSSIIILSDKYFHIRLM